MRTKTLPLVVLLVALAGLAGSGAWAVNRESGDGHGWMHSSKSAWMMGTSSGSAQPVQTIDDARIRAQKFADRLGLRVSEVMQFTNNFYARLDDKSGKPATEVLVDPSTARTSLEYGPAMMWNTDYGMPSGRFGAGMMSGGGMMGGSGGAGATGMMGGSMMNGSSMMGSATPSAGTSTGRVTAQEAMRIADRRLAQRDPSLSVPDADAFPGYYTMEIERHGKIVGMLSVNATSGAVWEHWWHGSFVAISE